jgi:hypothetical protein
MVELTIWLPPFSLRPFIPSSITPPIAYIMFPCPHSFFPLIRGTKRELSGFDFAHFHFASVQRRWELYGFGQRKPSLLASCWYQNFIWTSGPLVGKRWRVNELGLELEQSRFLIDIVTPLSFICGEFLFSIEPCTSIVSAEECNTKMLMESQPWSKDLEEKIRGERERGRVEEENIEKECSH